MNKLLEVAKNMREVMARQDIVCPNCGEKQWSPFDKLYCESYGVCYTCDSFDEIKGNNILSIIEGG
jgi:hypothetical protein